MGITVHRHGPLPTWAQGLDDEGLFAAAWERVDLPSVTWRASRIRDDGFLKGMAVPIVCRSQMWKRRWDIHQEAQNLLALEPTEVPVPPLMAWGHEDRGPLPVRSWLLTQVVPGARNLDDVVSRLTQEQDDASLREALVAAGGAVRTLHGAGWVHDDMAARNLVLKRESGAWQAFPVDVARAHRPEGSQAFARGVRVDLYRMAKTILRHRLPDEHVAAMIDAAAPGQGQLVTGMTRTIRSIGNRYLRMARYHAWTRLAR